MKLQRQILLLTFLSSPLHALAHGEQVLFPIFFEFIGLILGVVILSSLKLNFRGKLILSLGYILSTFLALLILNSVGYLVFLKYLVLMNVVLITIPWLITFGIYLLVKDKFKKVT